MPRVTRPFRLRNSCGGRGRAPLKDEDRVEYAAVEEMSRRVIAYGPLCGLGAYNIGNDYYNADANYK